MIFCFYDKDTLNLTYKQVSCYKKSFNSAAYAAAAAKKGNLITQSETDKSAPSTTKMWIICIFSCINNELMLAWLIQQINSFYTITKP